MTGCQVGNLEYALSLDPSNPLLQKRLSEAKVRVEHDGPFFGIHFCGGSWLVIFFLEEDKGWFLKHSHWRHWMLGL